jgi:ABC-type uncharacterized transport system ATPase component
MAAMVDADREHARALAADIGRRRERLHAAEARLRDRARARIDLLDGGQHPPGSLSPAAHHGESAAN